ncbi:MAG: peptidase [Pseudomonas sp.]|uniref:S26 family signal peptidase n=1 Tax=Pseudomonas sp. FEMGT703P TaxID=2080764 RepID=UPI000CB397BA|nr:S26 family signal peptidase [Pseudomonas sp. FEMGT703P]PJE43114.1 MAG: peptidase [Pseudomonas sp.] [Pseudomonas sp. FEMGT703P]
MSIGTVLRSRSRRCARLVQIGLSVCSLAALVSASFVQPDPRVIYNASDSVPVGWYRVDPAGLRTDLLPVGSLVMIRLPDAAAALAAQRGYLPISIPLLKRVGAVAPQEVCVAGGSVRIDGVPVAVALRVDQLGRPLQAWPGCRRLHPGELFLLSTTNTASFDSRYFGPVGAFSVLGVAHPLWLEEDR